MLEMFVYVSIVSACLTRVSVCTPCLHIVFRGQSKAPGQLVLLTAEPSLLLTPKLSLCTVPVCTKSTYVDT